MRDTTRRALLRNGALGGALLAATRWLRAEPPPQEAPPGASPAGGRPADAGGFFRISLAQWSLHRALREGRLDPLDFPKVAMRDYGIAGCEYVSTFYRDKATDFGYLRELDRRAHGEGVASLLIMIDGEGALGDADDPARRQAVENHHKWIAAAAFLGCHSIRVNAEGGGPREEHAARAADSLHRLGAFADAYGVNVIVENHGGPSSDGRWLSGVLAAADHPRVGALPDFGNFGLGDGRTYDRYRGVSELMPFARAVSAKTYDFDAAGNETTIDYRRMLTIVRDAGYRAWLGIEYEGDRLPEPDGIRATKALLETLRDELS